MEKSKLNPTNYSNYTSKNYLHPLVKSSWDHNELATSLK